MDRKITKLCSLNDRNEIARKRLSKKFAEKQTHSLWSDPEIQKTIDSLSPEDRYKFSTIGEELFKPNGFIDSVSNIKKDPTNALFDIAAQLQTMIRDGINPEDLTKEEQRILISVMGPDDAKSKYGLSLGDDVLKVI